MFFDKDVLKKYPQYIGIIKGNYMMKIKTLYAEVTNSLTSPNKPAALYVASNENPFNGTIITDFSTVKHADRCIDLFL